MISKIANKSYSFHKLNWDGINSVHIIASIEQFLTARVIKFIIIEMMELVY